MFSRSLFILFWVAMWATIPVYAQASDLARFRVSPEVVTPDLPPFTATSDAFGNGHRLSGAGGFEPTIFRTLIRPKENSANTIIAAPEEIAFYDSWRDGALDGAEVEVLRIEDGHLRSVRQDRIREGGFRASGWIAQFGGQVLPKTTTSVRVSWDPWNRLGVPYYFTVRAVDRSGRLSPEAPPIPVMAPSDPGETALPERLEKRDSSDRGETRLSPPQDLRAALKLDRTVELSWAPVKGARGYIVYRSETPPEAHRGYAIDLEGTGVPIRAGDMVILRKRILGPRREDLVTHRIWGAFGASSRFRTRLVESWPDAPDKARWSLREHPAETPVTEAGETYLHAHITPRQPLKIGLANHSGTVQNWYPVLDPDKTYRFEVWLRGDPGVTATFQLGRAFAKTAQGVPAHMTVTPTWQKHVVEFRVPTRLTRKMTSTMELILQGAGQVSVDNFRIYRADAPYLGWLPEERTALMSSGMGELRTHGFIKTFQRSYDLAQLTNPRGAISMAQGNTLPQTLDALRDVGMDPWLQIEPHFSRAEWLGLAEYLAAPFDPATDDPLGKPWAAKRAAQGHPAPYTEDFKQIRFEIGNETWNQMFRPWTFEAMTDAESGRAYTPGEVYGLYQEYVLSIFKESPYWAGLEPKLVPVIGGWVINSYGDDAARMSPDTPLVTVAEYNGGWDQGEGVVTETPAGFASVLGFAPQTVAARAQKHMAQAQEAATARGVALAVGTYEAGPGYAMNGLNNARVTEAQALAQERVMKSAAAGTATLDTFLTQARAGYRLQNYFTFGAGDFWRSHAQWYHGGQAYPAWQWLSALNRAGQGPGDLLQVTAQEVPRRDLAGFARREGVKNAPMVDVYPLLKDGQLMVVVLSRMVPDVPQGADGITEVSIELPFSSAQSMSRITMTGDLRATNVFAPEAMLEHTTMEVQLPRLHIPALPPGKAEIYIYDGITP